MPNICFREGDGVLGFQEFMIANHLSVNLIKTSWHRPQIVFLDHRQGDRQIEVAVPDLR